MVLIMLLVALWQGVQKLAALALVLCLGLYGLRSLSAGQFLTLDQFELFFRGLCRYIFG